jgi:hypothetical protein
MGNTNEKKNRDACIRQQLVIITGEDDPNIEYLKSLGIKCKIPNSHVALWKGNRWLSLNSLSLSKRFIQVSCLDYRYCFRKLGNSKTDYCLALRRSDEVIMAFTIILSEPNRFDGVAVRVD